MLTSRAWFKAVVELRHDYTDEIVDANGVGLAQKKSAAQLGSFCKRYPCDLYNHHLQIHRYA